MVFNNVNVSQCKSQKHLGIILDSKLIFEDHYKTVLSKTKRTMGLLCKLQNLLPREALITVYKAFVKLHLYYGDALFNQAFEDQYKAVLSKTIRAIELLRKLRNLLPRGALITIYKAFVRPHLDYDDVSFDQAFNASSHEKLESMQYNACLALTVTIRGTSEEKLCQELGLESLQLRHSCRKLYLFRRFSKINLQPICLI